MNTAKISGTLRMTLLTLCLLTLPRLTRADDLVLAAEGTSAYAIVLPDGTEDPIVDQALHQTARLVQQAFKVSGFELAILAESNHPPETPAIFLGNTAFARAHGVDPARLEGWDYVHKVVDGHVIIAGRDHAPPDLSALGGDWGRYFYYRLGTLKGATDFLRTYTQTYFLYPGYNHLPVHGAGSVPDWNLDRVSIEYTPRDTITVPADLDLHKAVFTRYHKRHHRSALLYDVANNFLPRVDDALLGHTYGRAIPPDTYRESNPEYFALLGGERTRHNQYCLSNPEVRELIYQFTAGFLEAGCQSVNILQPDGFRACQCDACRALYDTGTDWGEKLWIFHRHIAERLQKDHPDKKLLISPYTVTLDPPKSFDRFPDNVIISHVDANFEETEKWRKWRKLHDGEYGIWIHNWIANQTSRYTPQRTPLFIERQVRFFHDTNVRGVFRDGLGEVYGLEGPTYYVFGRMFDDPETLDARTLMFEFCDASFGGAAAAMRRFYDALYHNLEPYALYLNTHGVGWAYKDIYGRGHKMIQNPFRMLSFIYTPRLLNSMEDFLAQAESKAGGTKHKARLGLVRREFDYLKALMRVIHLYQAYATEPTLETRDRLLNAIDDRNAYIASLYEPRKTGKYDRARTIEGWDHVLFPPGGHNIAHLQLEHNTYGNAFADTCLNWDTDAMRKAPLPGTEQVRAPAADGEVSLDTPQWQEVAAAELQPVSPGDAAGSATSIRILHGAEKVHLRITATLADGQDTFPELGRDAELRNAESVDMYLAPDPTRDIYYRFTVGPHPGSVFDAARGLITDRMNLRYNRDDPDWNGEWSYVSRIDTEQNLWHGLLSIPYATLATARPVPEDTWRANFGRTRVAGTNGMQYSIWSNLGGTRDVADRDALGEILFTPEPGAREEAPDEHPATAWRKKHYDATFEIPAAWRELSGLLPGAPGPWLFRLDPIEKGLEEAWYQPDTDTSAWEPIPVPAFWNEFKWGRFEGVAWYRTRFTVPTDWEGHAVRLLFGSVDEEAWIYVNGQPVGEHSRASTGKSINELWEEPFIVEVPVAALNYGEENVLIVRVNNTAAGGGIWRPVLVQRGDNSE